MSLDAAISKDEMKDDLDHQRSKRAKLDGAAAHQERVIQDRVTILSAIVPKVTLIQLVILPHNMYSPSRESRNWH